MGRVAAGIHRHARVLFGAGGVGESSSFHSVHSLRAQHTHTHTHKPRHNSRAPASSRKQTSLERVSPNSGGRPEERLRRSHEVSSDGAQALYVTRWRQASLCDLRLRVAPTPPRSRPPRCLQLLTIIQQSPLDERVLALMVFLFSLRFQGIQQLYGPSDLCSPG